MESFDDNNQDIAVLMTLPVDCAITTIIFLGFIGTPTRSDINKGLAWAQQWPNDGPTSDAVNPMSEKKSLLLGRSTDCNNHPSTS